MGLHSLQTRLPFKKHLFVINEMALHKILLKMLQLELLPLQMSLNKF